jgi:hypothetical protein
MKHSCKELKEKITKEFLIEEHYNKEKPPKQIAKEIGCDYTTILNYMDGFNISLVDWYTKKWEGVLTKDFLFRNYTIKKLSPVVIAKNVGLGCTAGIIRKYLIIYEIPLRNFKNRVIDYKIVGEKVSKTLKGRIGPFLNHRHTKEAREKISKSKLNKKQSKEHVEKRRKALLGYIFSQERNRKVGLANRIKNKGKKKPPRTKNHIQNLLKSICILPNKFEIKCMAYLDRMYPNKFKYTGNGSFLVDSCSPDAYSEELNTVCLFQGDYFHCNPKKYKGNYYNQMVKKTAQEIWDKDNQVIKTFKKEGYKVVIIWEGEIKELLKEGIK